MTPSADAPLRCEQLVYTWAPRTLSTVNGGMGVVGRSAGWPLDYQAGWFGYIPTNSVRHLDNAPGPLVIARHNTPVGTLVLHKRALVDGAHARPGNYLVHALLDPSGRLGAREVLALHGSSLLRSSWSEPEPVVLPQLELPQLRIDPPAMPEEDLRSLLPLLVEAVLAHPRTGARCVLSVGDEGTGVAWLRHLASALPDAWAAELTVSTYEQSHGVHTPTVTLLNEAFQDRPLPPSTVLITPGTRQLARSIPGERALARELVDQYLGGSPQPADLARATSVDQLNRVLETRRLATTPVEQLDARDVALLAGDMRWVQANLIALLERMTLEPLHAAVTTGVAGAIAALPAPARDQVTARLLRTEAHAWIAGAGQTHARSLLPLVGIRDDDVALAALRYATAKVEKGSLQQRELERAFPLILRLEARLSLRDRQLWLGLAEVPQLLASSRHWTGLHALMLRHHLLRAVVDDGQVAAVGRFLDSWPDECLDVIRELVTDGASAAGVVDRMTTASPAGGPLLLLRAGLPASVVVHDVLPLLEDEQLLGELHQHWPALGVAAGLPPRIAALLAPVAPGRPACADASARTHRLWGRRRTSEGAPWR